MSTVKSIKRTVIAGVSALSLLFGAFFMASAMDNETVKETDSNQTIYRWFKISNNHTPGSSVPSSDADYIQTSATPPTGEECPDGNKYQCVSGFLESQTTPSGSGDYVLNGSQAPNSSASNVLRN